eukprot:COSAG01_NODE_46125_length_402_cov_149.293729_1_plen_33_part_10
MLLGLVVAAVVAISAPPPNATCINGAKLHSGSN